MDYGKLTIDEIKKGYRLDKEASAYVCNYCNKKFQEGQVYSIGENFYVPEHAAADHIETEHGGNMNQLLYSDSKYNTLTDNQKELLSLFYADMSDSEIAKKLGLSASTIRHQKFTFREKAKQYKLFLAMFEHVFEDKPKNEESIIPIHNHATYYDDRYVITEEERTRILKTSFESLEPLRLKVFSSKEKKKVVIMTKIIEQFQLGKKYTEKEVNEILKPIYDDYALIRRFLIMYGFIERADDGSLYWLTQ